MVNHKSTFPVDIGVKITGVDSNTFSLTGESYAAVLPAESKSETSRKLQADDVALGAMCGLNVVLFLGGGVIPTHKARSTPGMHSLRVFSQIPWSKH